MKSKTYNLNKRDPENALRFIGAGVGGIGALILGQEHIYKKGLESLGYEESKPEFKHDNFLEAVPIVQEPKVPQWAAGTYQAGSTVGIIGLALIAAYLGNKIGQGISNLLK